MSELGSSPERMWWKFLVVWKLVVGVGDGGGEAVVAVGRKCCCNPVVD